MRNDQSIVRKLRKAAEKVDCDLYYNPHCFTWYFIDMILGDSIMLGSGLQRHDTSYLDELVARRETLS